MIPTDRMDALYADFIGPTLSGLHTHAGAIHEHFWHLLTK